MTEQPRRPAWTLLCVLLGSVLALYACLQGLPAVHVDDAWLPVSHDSFYHARRILDAVADPAGYYQFDVSIHAPEGSWLTWPWAYDWLLAKLTRLGMVLGGVQDPMALLVFIPPLAVVINVALIAGIARRTGLSPSLQLLAVVIYALLPLTQGLHGVGILDHHYVEHSFVLLTVYLGLAWFASGLRPWYGILLGFALGCATAFHNSLFVLQVPVVLTTGLLWLRGEPALRSPGAALFGLALLLATLLCLLPSEPFRLGFNDYYLHGWFHFYVAACTALLMACLSRWPYSLRALLLLLVLVDLLAIVAWQQVASGVAYVTADMPGWEDIAETASLFSVWQQQGLAALAGSYSWLILLLPVVLAWYGWRLLREREGGALFFAVMVVFGSVLLLAQWRMHYFGSFALIIPLLLLAQHVLQAFPARRVLVQATTWLLAGLALLPAFARLQGDPLITRSFEYGLTRGIYDVMAQACAEAPGVVLAGKDDGHYIRFHTGCPVIANNFIITPQQARKVAQTRALLAGPAADIVEHEPWIRYVYVNRMDNVLAPGDAESVRAANAGVRETLLLSDGPWPDGYVLLSEIRLALQPGSPAVALARLFRIDRPVNR